MTSFLKLALEGELGTLDTGGGQPEAHEQGEKDLMILKGPLAEQFSQALAQMYDKNKSVEQQEEATAVEGVAIESQANDALSLADLADSVQILGEDDEQDGATTVYGVDANDAKPEDVVEVSQDIDDFDAEDPDFVLVMNGTGASVNGEESGEGAEPQMNEYGKALEALCDRAGVPVYFSLEAYAHAKKAAKIHKGMPEKQKEVMMHFTKGKGKLSNGKAATDEGLGLEYCDPEVLGVVTKLAQEKIDVNLGDDTEFFPEGTITKLKAEKVKEFVKEIEMRFGKIDKDAGMQMTTPKSIAKYFSKGKINGKPVKTV